jgi:hypothetical protein
MVVWHSVLVASLAESRCWLHRKNTGKHGHLSPEEQIWPEEVKRIAGPKQKKPVALEIDGRGDKAWVVGHWILGSCGGLGPPE